MASPPSPPSKSPTSSSTRAPRESSSASPPDTTAPSALTRVFHVCPHCDTPFGRRAKLDRHLAQRHATTLSLPDDLLSNTATPLSVALRAALVEANDAFDSASPVCRLCVALPSARPFATRKDLAMHLLSKHPDVLSISEPSLILPLPASAPRSATSAVPARDPSTNFPSVLAPISKKKKAKKKKKMRRICLPHDPTNTVAETSNHTPRRNRKTLRAIEAARRNAASAVIGASIPTNPCPVPRLEAAQHPIDLQAAPVEEAAAARTFVELGEDGEVVKASKGASPVEAVACRKPAPVPDASESASMLNFFDMNGISANKDKSYYVRSDMSKPKP